MSKDADEYEEILLALQQIWPQFDFNDAIKQAREEVQIE